MGKSIMNMYLIYINYRLAQGHLYKGIIEFPFFVDRVLEILFKSVCSMHKIGTNFYLLVMFARNLS